MAEKTLPALATDIRLFGKASDAVLTEFFHQQSETPPSHAVVQELGTSGGNADVGRRIAQDRLGGADARS